MITNLKKQLQEKGEVYLRVKARPGAGCNQILEIMADDTIKIAIKAPAEKGKANQELIKFLAKEFSVAKENVKIISGAGERLKLIKMVL